MDVDPKDANLEDPLSRHPTLLKYHKLLVQMTRDSRNDSAAQLLHLQNLCHLFSDALIIQLENNYKAVLDKLERDCHFTKAVHRAIASNPAHPRVCSLGLRILAHMASIFPSTINAELIFQHDCLTTAVDVLRTHASTDVSTLRSALCLLTTLLGCRINHSSAVIKFQRIPMIGPTLNTIIKQNMDDATTIEWGLAACSYVGNYGGRNLLETICQALSTHPTDLGIVRASLSALCSLARIKMHQIVLIGCGIFKLIRSLLDLRPATRDVSIKACILITSLLQCEQGRESFMRNSSIGKSGNRKSIKSGSNGERLVQLISDCLPSYGEIALSSFALSMRCVLNALTMIALSSDQARTLLMHRCQTADILEQFLELKLPTVRLRFDIEMALAAVNGEVEEEAKANLFKEMDNGGSGGGDFNLSSSLKISRGQVMKPTKNQNGVIVSGEKKGLLLGFESCLWWLVSSLLSPAFCSCIFSFSFLYNN